MEEGNRFPVADGGEVTWDMVVVSSCENGVGVSGRGVLEGEGELVLVAKSLPDASSSVPVDEVVASEGKPEGATAVFTSVLSVASPGSCWASSGGGWTLPGLCWASAWSTSGCLRSSLSDGSN